MDSIQKVLIKMGRKDLAQEYYKKAINKKVAGIPQPTIRDSGSGIIEVIMNEPRYKLAVRNLAEVLQKWAKETNSNWENGELKEMGIKNIAEAVASYSN